MRLKFKIRVETADGVTKTRQHEVAGVNIGDTITISDGVKYINVIGRLYGGSKLMEIKIEE